MKKKSQKKKTAPSLKAIPFDAETTRYRPTNAFWLAEAASAAYQKNSAAVRARARSLHLPKFKALAKGNIEGFVAANDRVIIISFRGTEPKKVQDWMSDAKVHKVRGPLGDVHRGFLGGYRLIRADVEAAIAKYQSKSSPRSVWITGHSLGGALAVVAAAHFLEDEIPFNGVYTFGQPRVGNDTFVQNFQSMAGRRHFRIVNNNDIVTRVAPRSFGYRHSGEIRYIDPKGRIHDDIHWWNKFLSRVGGRVKDLGKPGTDGLKDHSMKRYVRHLKSSRQGILTAIEEEKITARMNAEIVAVVRLQASPVRSILLQESFL